jgi:hypothetical protein
MLTNLTALIINASMRAMMATRAARRKMRTRCCGSHCYSGRMTPRCQFDAYVIDVLMPDLVAHDRQPSAFILYLRLWRATGGGRTTSPALSLRELSDTTGLSKRSIQDAVDTLERRQLIGVDRALPTAVPTYRVLRPWRRAPRSRGGP